MRPSLPGTGNSRSALHKHTPAVRRVHVLAALEVGFAHTLPAPFRSFPFISIPAGSLANPHFHYEITSLMREQEESEVQDGEAQVNSEQAVPEDNEQAVPEEAASEDTQASSSSEDVRAGFTAQFKLNVLWQDDFCAVAVDQVIRTVRQLSPTRQCM